MAETAKTKEVKAASAWDRTVTVMTPRARKGEEPFKTLYVNGRHMDVPLDGKPHELPEPFADNLTAALAAEAYADEYADAMSANMPKQ